jgi:hypothetical protein
MTNTIKWYYEGTEIYFLSTEDNFERHKLQNAGRLGLTNPQVTIIENATTDSSPTTNRPCRNCGAESKSKSALPVDTEATPSAGVETLGLFDLSSVPPDVDTAADPVGTDELDLDLLGGSVDRLAL